MSFKLNAAVRKFATDNLGVKADADDNTFKVSLAKAVSAGKISPKQLSTLMKGDDPTPPTGAKGAKDRKQKSEKFSAAVGKAVEAALKNLGIKPDRPAVDPEALLAKAAGSNPRVKGVVDQYAQTKKSATYPENCGVKADGSFHLMAGQPARLGKKTLSHPSELDRAVSGAFFKWQVNLSAEKGQVPAELKMSQEDHDLVAYALHELPWTGILNPKGVGEYGPMKVNNKRLSDMQRKTLLDDTASGGIEVTPYVFDEAIILTPVLFGELFPLVQVVNVARGRRVHGASMINPTWTSGTAEGTLIQPFATGSFISAFDTPIYAAVAAIEIGQDFEDDSPVAVGDTAIQQFGLTFLQWLDRVIAVGDGVTEPLGIKNTTGITTLNSDAGSGGPITVSDLEGLQFAVAKQFRNEPGAVPVYISNDTMYRRVRGIQVGPGDQRRVFGMDQQSYKTFGYGHKIQNDLVNGYMAFANLQRYRMYRRLGMTVRVETAGRTLALQNTKLVVMRARIGGQLTLGGAAAAMSDLWN